MHPNNNWQNTIFTVLPVPVDAALPKCISDACVRLSSIFSSVFGVVRAVVYNFGKFYTNVEQYVCEERAQNLDKV